MCFLSSLRQALLAGLQHDYVQVRTNLLEIERAVSVSNNTESLYCHSTNGIQNFRPRMRAPFWHNLDRRQSPESLVLSFIAFFFLLLHIELHSAYRKLQLALVRLISFLLYFTAYIAKLSI